MDPSLFRYAWHHSKAQQILLLAVILVSLPFYWVSLEVPKLIVNNAIQGNAFADGQVTAVLFDWHVELPALLGGGSFSVSDGLILERLPYLIVLSCWFLVLVLINGAFKYYINVKKGVLGEAMLRRMRHDLFILLLRFRPEDIAAVKPAEVASMIKDEVDPIGGFVGDAFIQPVFLGTQAATALIFIFFQSVWMGLATFLIVAVQAVAIPILRREQLRLGRLRQIESRRLAGRIGEVVESAPTVHTYGASAYVDADIDQRLGTLFGIRTRLFKRKFAVKFLNNLLSQVTPFIFYAAGGYFALRGEMDIGQLVAVIAAYRDLPPPIKELIDWDQQRQDVAIKYEQVISQFSPSSLLPPFDSGVSPAFPGPEAPIEFQAVTVGDGRSGAQLDRLSLTLPRPGHAALLGNPGSARDIVGKLLGRQITAYEGRILVGDVDLAHFSEPVFTRHLIYCGAGPDLQPGTLRDNLLFAARRSGDPAGDLDYGALGIQGPDQVNQCLGEAVKAVGALEEVRRLGLNQRLKPAMMPDVADCFVAARRLVQERIIAANLGKVVERFDADRYGAHATISENLLFGIPVGPKLSAGGLARDSYTLTILEAEGLLQPLISFGRQIAEMALETFGGLPPDHPVFERYSFIAPSQLDDLRAVIDALGQASPGQGVSAAIRTQLIALAFDYVEPRHRLGLITPEFATRLLRARASFKQHLPQDYNDDIEFYDYDAFMREAPVIDNLLFGRVASGVMGAQKKISPIIAGVISEIGLDDAVFGLGLDVEVGKGGRLLQPLPRIKFGVARALVVRPDILVLDGTIGNLAPAEAQALLAGVRQAMAGKTLVVTTSEAKMAEGFDSVFQFKDARLVSNGAAAEHKSAAAAG
ncbi:ABC transporter ATP-binding protein [Oleomonas cavernae]|uniref:ABC transporter ATP-binding protein n=1 Tax=Oleomonas cavernae TaxID=2320859 RepID=A0A418VUE6_9PROT|nr:ABC transporter transmembrane domain-containing protein [Oleomonas cavernae]RJF80781.1 ABC transporter ATP-binding protein [Oleomonas cavernae]